MFGSKPSVNAMLSAWKLDHSVQSASRPIVKPPPRLMPTPVFKDAGNEISVATGCTPRIPDAATSWSKTWSPVGRGVTVAVPV